MIGGVIVNVLLAIVIFIGITWVWGEENLPVKNLKYGIYTDSLARSMGLKDGDNIVGIDGKPIEYFGMLESEIVLSEAKKLVVLREGQTIELPVPEGFINKIVKNKKFSGLVYPRYPAIVDSVSKTANFTKDRLQKGDKLIAFNNKPFEYYHEFDKLKKGYNNSL
ncbi:MAG: M50 family metallopeptidase, partial [Bacteroidota bacterium]